MDSLKVLSMISSISGSSCCNCNKTNANTLLGSNSGFDLVVESLIKAVSNREQYTNIDNGDVKGEGVNIMENVLTPVLNSNNNVSKIEPTNKDESINIRIKNAVSNASKKHGVDADLIMSIIKVESNFKPNTVSRAGAKGLMQLMPVNIKTYGVTDPFNIEQNIDAGTRHIKDYIDMYNGDLEMGLMAYNGGPGNMKKRGVKSPSDIYKMPKETQNYVPKVLNLYRG